jgi:Ion channel
LLAINSRKAADTSLTALLTTQCLITFVLIPLLALNDASRWMLDVGHLVFATLCAMFLTNHLGVRATLIGLLLAVAAAPVLDRVALILRLDSRFSHGFIAIAAFVFNAIVTVLVARTAFTGGQVSQHRILGAVLVYLNVAVLFSIAYEMLEAYSPGAIRPAADGQLLRIARGRIAEFSYFSLTTITTCGYGDLVPAHPIARSMANLEAVFGQLFPATFVARLVALHLAHTDLQSRNSDNL